MLVCFILSAVILGNDFTDASKLTNTKNKMPGNDAAPESMHVFHTSNNKTMFVKIKEGQKVQITRNAFSDADSLWPDGKVPFVFDSNVPAFSKIEIMAAMQEIEMSTYSNGQLCVMFVPRQSESDYLHVSWTSATHGSTSIGRDGGRQELIINTAGGFGHDDTLNVLMAVLGLFPEVMRSDRDSYLTVNYNNIASTIPFRTLNGQSTSFYGQPFDYKSVLLFTPYIYAVDPSVPSITSKTSGQVLGQSVSLSSGDATLLQHTYKCHIDSSNVIDILGALPLKCHFHTDICTFIQDTTDNFDWVVQAGPTTTFGTGPYGDYSSGNGKFALAQARNHHNQVARLISHQFPAGQYCLRVNLHMYGSDEGKLRIFLTSAGGDVDILNNSGSLPNSWHHAYLTFNTKTIFKMTIEAAIGNGDKGDIAIDDIYMYNGKCIEWN